MRLLLLNQFYVPDLSPTAQLVASLADHRAARGDEVTVIASRGSYVSPGNPATARVTLRNAVNLIRVWTPNLGKKTVLRRCADYGTFYVGACLRVATLPEQDVIVSLTTPPYLAWAAVIHKLKHPRAKLILWCMDCYPEAAERLGKLKAGGRVATAMRWLNRQLFRRCDHVVCLDYAMRDLVLKQCNPDTKLRASVIPNWEPLESFKTPSAEREWLGVTRHGLSGRFVVLYLGNMGEGHDFTTVLNAAERLAAEPVSFVFVGGGRRKEEIRRAARARHLSNVSVHDYVPEEELRSVMACADCALITLRDDCVGIMSPSKLHANLAMQLPIVFIGPQGCNVAEAIDRFDCGVSLRTGDVDGLVAFVRRALEKPDEFSNLGVRARHAFETAYSDAQTLPQFDVLLDSLGGTVSESWASVAP